MILFLKSANDFGRMNPWEETETLRAFAKKQWIKEGQSVTRVIKITKLSFFKREEV